MITYNGSEWGSLMSLNGSVFPRACKLGIASSLIGFVLKLLESEDHISFKELRLLTNSNGFSMFSATLAFVLIFRTSKCYLRFWQCATSVSTMRAMMCEAASSLIVFTNMSKAPEQEIMYFRHKIVRLTSLLHATCLASFCDRETRFEIIDIKSFCQEDLNYLQEASSAKMRVDIVYTWLNVLVMKSLASGLLNVPPPILSRVFQQFEKGMVEFHQVQQVMSIPFPFPYAQMAVVLLLAMVVCTPIAMCFWTGHPVSTACLTFVAIVCLTSLELIADELDNPFGDDANDLPCMEFQAELNSSLALLVTPIVDTVPDLAEKNVERLNAKVKQAI
jgi:putative membrane protein